MCHLYLSCDLCGADIANKASMLTMQRVVLNLRTMVLKRANIHVLKQGTLQLYQNPIRRYDIKAFHRNKKPKQ